MTLKIETDDVRELPPSAKLVYLILQETGPCTQAEISNRAQLPRRTVRHALAKLQDSALIEAQPYLGDARQNLYDITPVRDFNEC